METRIDFIQCLQSDISLCILKYLDDPSDLIRVSSVSHFWRHFAIENGLFEQLCKRIFPQLAQITKVIELEEQHTAKRSVGVGSSNLEWKVLERAHKAYGSLFQAISAFRPRNCLGRAISASSTDNYPEESIVNTLHPGDIVLERASYWSSTGQSDPQVPETLIYRLRSNLCAITEINIQPFQAYFQPGMPIYAPKSVRFRMGYPKSTSEMESIKRLPLENCADDKFVWTFSSQEFPMAHDNRMQSCKFAEPFVCIGGYLRIELLGRVQKQEMDGLLYICISHVQVIGRRLTPAFEADVIEPGKFLLKYSPDRFEDILNDDQYDAVPNRFWRFVGPGYIIPRNELLNVPDDVIG